MTPWRSGPSGPTTSPDPEVPGTPPQAVRENIETVLRVESGFLSRRTAADRVSDGIAAFVGTLAFVVLHFVWFAAWALVNAGMIGAIKPFDPYPFQLLAMIVSLEGVLITTFVLIKQNRMSDLSERRAHVDLQVNLLTERETTRLLRLTEEIATHLGVRGAREGVGELGEDTKVEGLIEALDQGIAKGTGAGAEDGGSAAKP